jgi:hypothetical protein
MKELPRIVCEHVVMDRQTRNYIKVHIGGYRLVEAASEWASYEQVFIQVIHACTRSTTFLDRARFSKCRLRSDLCNDAPMLSSVRH